VNPPVATLGGVLLANAASVSWDAVTGAGAPTKTYVVHKEQWPGIQAQMGKRTTLKIQPENAPAYEWTGLYILREAPTQMPFHRAFVVSDIRWRFPRALVVGAFNIPRKTGTRRIVGGGPVEITQPIDTYAYAKASLNHGARWTARQVVDHVLARILADEGFGWRIESFPANTLTVEGLDLADSGDAALERALKHAPGAMVRVDPDGTVVVFDGLDRAGTKAAMDGAGPRTGAGNIDRVVSLMAIRPRAIRAHFERDIELRFDAIEESDTDTVYAVDVGNDPDMTMENCLPLPDPYTTIAGQRVAQGTWVPLRIVIPVWAAEVAQVSGPPLTFANIRKYWFTLDSMYLRFDKLDQGADDKSWAARIAAIKAHYRQTYIINPEWMRYIRDLKPQRVGVLDPVTGTRSPSMAWSQYAIIPSDKAKAYAAIWNRENQFVSANINGYPGIDAELYEQSAAPAVVEVLDRELGILKINYRTDPHGMRSSVVPSQFKELGSGRIVSLTRDLKKQMEFPIAFGCQVKSCLPVFLADDHRAAIIVTARPFGAHSKSRCLMYEVKPGDIKQKMAASFDVDGGDGPTWNLYVPPSLMTAWYAHVGTVKARESALALFGFKGDPPASTAPGYEIVNLEDNSDATALIPAVAQALAIAVWALYVDQVEGSPAFHLDPALRLVGSIDAIRHRLDPDGRLVTQAEMGPARRIMDALAVLPTSLRSMILGTIPEMPA